MKKEAGFIIKSNRLKKFEQDLSLIEKSKGNVEKELAKHKKHFDAELSRLRVKEEKLRDEISKEKKAINLSNKAKKLRSRK